MNYAEDSIEEEENLGMVLESDKSEEDSWSSSSSEFLVPGMKHRRKITLDDQEAVKE